MKKIFTSMVVALMLMATTTAQAQVKLGLKGGLNVTQMSLSSDVIDKSNQTGFFVGPTVKLTLPLIGLGIDAAALYDQRDAKLGEDDDESTISQRCINIPVNLRYGFGLGSMASVYVAAGPQFGFNIGQKNYGSDTDGFKFKDSNLSLNLGAGVSVLTHLELGFTYNIALGKTGEVSVTNSANKVLTSKARNNSWQVSAAYYF